LSFAQGVFPDLLKNAIVIPIYKGGSHMDPSNYRPISILTLFSKLLEKLFYNRLLCFINNNNVLHSNQFGFRKNKSTSLAVANVISSIINKVKNDKKVALVLLDLKKAFDFINHDLLINKLKHYGIRGLPQQWLISYLLNRSQKVKVNCSFSTNRSVSAGVPQGSVLGPLLFNIFINDTFQFMDSNCEILLYADDTAIIFSSDTEVELQLLVNNFFIDYCAWCDTNCIVVNPVKSNFLLFNVADIVVSINGHGLKQCDYAKYLGILIDDKLLWSRQVNHVFNLCCQRIGVFKKVLPYLPNYVLPMYYNAFVKSCFSYCIMIWFNNVRSGRQKLIDKIDTLIDKLVKLLSVNNSTCHVSTFCSVMDVYKLQSLSFMYDLCNNIITVPHVSLIHNNMIHRHFTRQSNNLHINSVSSLDCYNFIYHCTVLWNKCPEAIRVLPRKSLFLKSCKTFISSNI
jgi:hypothetical protein